MKNNQKLNIFYEITNACNHKCIHCCKYWEENEHIRSGDISTLDKILKIPKQSLTITGGEPGIVKDKVRYLIDHEIVPITINTNLTLWSKTDLDFFKSRNITLNVSVVSMIKDNYIDITGADTYDKMMGNLSYISRNNFISFIINNKNLKFINYNTKILLLMGFKNILISPQTPTPYNSIDLDYTKQKIISLYDKYKNIANITTQGCIGSMICDHECEAGLKRIMIDTIGDVYPCSPMGNIKHKLGNINDKHFDINTVKQNGESYYFSYPEKLQKICKGFVDTGQIY